MNGNVTTGASVSRPKIGDVAMAAGVSLGTVSAVLNGNGRISEATRERVREAMQALGYRPDLYASNLARRQSKLLGVVVSDLQSAFFAETAKAIEGEAASRGLQISLMATNFSPQQQRVAVQQLLGARLAGLAVMTSEYDPEAYALALDSGVPSVFLDTGKPSPSSSVIRVDSRGGMQAAVTHLLELGHRDLLFVRNSPAGTSKPLFSHRLRNQGFAAAVRIHKEDGLREAIVDIPGPSAEAGEAAIAASYGQVPFTAVIAITDTVAMGVYRGLQSRGLRIPQDVSVVGFDNTYFSPFLSPPLTTVDVPRTALSQLAVGALTMQAKRGVLKLPTSLVLRESTAPPPPRKERS